MTKEEKDFYKQLHHIIRLYDVLNFNVNVHQYEGEARDLMMAIKRGKFPETKEQAFLLRDEYVAKLSQIYEQRKIAYNPQEIDYEVLDKIVMNHYLATYRP